MTPAVVLIGLPGAGKSTVGRKLAQRLGVDFLDTDQEIEERTGQTIAEIFATSGEAEFRKIEREVVADVLSHREGVISLGGGAVLDSETQAQLSQLPVLWLQVDLVLASRRVSANTNRPLLQGDAREKLTAMAQQREPIYRKVATWRIPTSEGSPERTVERALEFVKGGIDDTD